MFLTARLEQLYTEKKEKDELIERAQVGLIIELLSSRAHTPWGLTAQVILLESRTDSGNDGTRRRRRRSTRRASGWSRRPRSEGRS